jgi:hypothetical protein
MQIDCIIWDLDDDPLGNVQHMAEHGLTLEEVEEVLDMADELFASNWGLPLVFGFTSTNKYVAVVFEIVEESPLTIRVVTAFETRP